MTVTIKARELDKDYCREQLLTHYLTEGQRVYTVLRHVSSSGMTRYISLLVSDGEQIRNITYYAAGALGESLHDINGQRAIKSNSLGMDAGWHLVDRLSFALYGEGNLIKSEWI